MNDYNSSINDPFQLPNSPTGNPNEVLPQELGQDFLSNLDTAFRRQERLKLNDLLADQERRGFLNSGDTFSRVADQILGPSLERRQQALLPLALQGAQAGREERLGSLAFERQRQFAQEEFQRRLQEMATRASFQRQLMELDEDMRRTGLPSFGHTLGQSFATHFGSSLGDTLGGGSGQGVLSGARSGGKYFGGLF